MYSLTYPNKNTIILWNSDWIKFIIEMYIEHYVPKLKDSIVLFNPDPSQTIQCAKKYPDHKTIIINLEHNFPCRDNIPNNCSQEWYNYLITQFPYTNEIWDFNIENYIFFEKHNIKEKFIFMPLRYTTWFEKFHSDKEPRYELEFEGVFDMDIRVRALYDLTSPYNDEGARLKFKLANTDEVITKYSDKLDAKWNLDIPHYDYPETINNTRICESICLNRPVICCDLYNIGSHAYFDNLVVYTQNLNPRYIKELVDMEPPQNVAQKFKEMTYLDANYEEYRRKIKDDFEKIANIKIPDSVLRNPLE